MTLNILKKCTAIILYLLILLLLSCNKDDFCDQKGTFRLVITFYDKDNPDQIAISP